MGLKAKQRKLDKQLKELERIAVFNLNKNKQDKKVKINKGKAKVNKEAYNNNIIKTKRRSKL